jgi:dUTP pyrophosphatase
MAEPAPRMGTVTVELERLAHGAGLPLPAPATADSAGVDLRAAIDGELWIAPGARRLVPTGFRWALPAGFEGQVRPRSGLALRDGVTLANSPGTLDADYRGELLVILVNLSNRPFRVRRGDRIAQLVIAPVAPVALAEVVELAPTGRGAGGFGSTGR